MVYTKHFCGICNEPYDSLNEAISCQSKGLMGCEIKPGLILKSDNHENSYRLFSTNSTAEHYRAYRIHKLNFNRKGKISSILGVYSITLDFRTVVSFLDNKDWSFIGEEELKKVEKNILKSKHKELQYIVEKCHPKKEFYNYAEEIDPSKINLAELQI
jgi:hypothetical protein